MKEAVEAARECAKQFDGLYEESAKNLLARTPDLMLLLSAFHAGREEGVQEEAQKHQPVQGTLDA